MNKELTIEYSGGSGGFLLLHFVLLNSPYRCAFGIAKQNIHQIVQHQWAIDQPAQWKLREVWPDNVATARWGFSNRVYFYCNPLKLSYYQPRGHRLVLYTDLQSQIRLCEFKRAHWFLNPTNTAAEILRRCQAEYQGLTVDCDILPCLATADATVRLQDLVNDPDSVVQALGLPEVNTAQRQLIDHWCSLHPRELLDSIGIYK